MIYAYEERIGDPFLFCGRQKQQDLLLNWANSIPRKIAKSRALLGRRKCGKSALMQRLFNILWNQNGPVIPFYFEVQDHNQWVLNFADNYYRTFMSQYLSFRSRRVLNLNNQPWKFPELINIAQELDEKNALQNMGFFQEELEKQQVGQAIDSAFGAPSVIAGREQVFILVMIDEIQFMTKYLFHDKEQQVCAYNLPGAFHGLSESKVVPMLVSGSYIGWMMQMMHEMFKGGRLKKTPISPKLTPPEGLEAVYRYAEYYQKPLSDEAAYVINLLTQSDPFYIASLLRSDWEAQDFMSVEGAINTLAYEVRNQEGELFGTWSEYIDSTIKEVNDQYAKQILLFLSKERYKEFTRIEISEHLGNKLSQRDLETRLRALEYGDLIKRPGISRFRYCGIPDDILDLIFRDLYQEEIDQVKPNIEKELVSKVKALEKKNQSLQGMVNELKGRLLEWIVYRELNQARKKLKPIKNLRQRVHPFLSPDIADKMADMLTLCEKSPIQTVWFNHYLQLPGTTALEIDVLAEGSDENHCWAFVFEIKNREQLPTMPEAKLFVTKIERLKLKLSETDKTIQLICPIYISAEGFDPPIEEWLQAQGILTADRISWQTKSLV